MNFKTESTFFGFYIFIPLYFCFKLALFVWSIHVEKFKKSYQASEHYVNFVLKAPDTKCRAIYQLGL